MAPNARVVKWLVSMYRTVLHRQWIDQRMESGEVMARRVGRGSAKTPRQRHHIEPLEQRVLLAADLLPGYSTYTTSPVLTNQEKGALVDGVTALRDRLVTLVDSNQFHTDVPGVLAYSGSFPFKVNPLDLRACLAPKMGLSSPT